MKDFFQIRTTRQLTEEHGAGEQGTPSLVAKYKNATPGQAGSGPTGQQPARRGDKLNVKEAYTGKNPHHIKSVYGSGRGMVTVTTNAGAKHTVSAKDTGGKMPSPGEHIGKYVKESNLDEGDVIHFPGKMKAEKEKPDTAPGWMLRKSPELAQKLKDAQDRVKKRKEIKEEIDEAVSNVKNMVKVVNSSGEVLVLINRDYMPIGGGGITDLCQQIAKSFDEKEVTMLDSSGKSGISVSSTGNRKRVTIEG